MTPVHINYIAVLVASVVGFMLGGLWYSNVLFGKTWITLMGFTDQKMEDMKKQGLAKNYIAMAIGKLLMAFVLAYAIAHGGITTMLHGAMKGFWVWLGFVAPVMMGSVLWEGKPVKLYVLNVSYYLVSLVVMGAILGLWR